MMCPSHWSYQTGTRGQPADIGHYCTTETAYHTTFLSYYCTKWSQPRTKRYITHILPTNCHLPLSEAHPKAQFQPKPQLYEGILDEIAMVVAKWSCQLFEPSRMIAKPAVLPAAHQTFCETGYWRVREGITNQSLSAWVLTLREVSWFDMLWNYSPRYHS